MKKILVVDDEKDLRWVLRKILLAKGYGVFEAENGANALKMLNKSSFDLVLLDNRMPGGMNGLEVLKKIMDIDPNILVIILTAFGNIKTAVTAIKQGAYDFLTKPFDKEELILTIEKALEKQRLLQEVKELKQKLFRHERLEEIMGTSDSIKKVFNQIGKVAPTNFTVLIQGETGTGKELVANAIHELSSRKDNPFIAVDCGTIPDSLVESELFGHEKGAFTNAYSRKEGQFELANKGTIFLDEISNLPYSVQNKLLRVLQERKIRRLGSEKSINVDIRIIAASNIHMNEHIKNRKFRKDLYYRLSEFTINMPALRKRKDDIPILVERFIQETNKELGKNVTGLSKEALKKLFYNNWEGNVRELKNIIRQAVLFTDKIIEPGHLIFNDGIESTVYDEDVLSDLSNEKTSMKAITKRTIVKIEKEMIINALHKLKGNKSKTAKILDIDYKTLHTKIKNYGIHSMEFMP